MAYLLIAIKRGTNLLIALGKSTSFQSTTGVVIQKVEDKIQKVEMLSLKGEPM
jgi:hypothetical protein